ncbi:methyltransferase [Kribbella deserti]|uniref:Methyltransferase n=1 Tax=Kribbella deserti TaxID=1926257 RepID=A0ABV6QT78_9ACTN
MTELSIDHLPATLSVAEIRAVNPPRPELHTHRTYQWNGWDFDLPPGVFQPGETSRLVHARLLDGTIDVAGRSYVAMGVGLGVEAVIAGEVGAAEIVAVDIDPDSVAVAADHFRRIHGDSAALRPIVSDLFDEVPDGPYDVITFNPPAVAERVSDDPVAVRNVCVGAGIATRFFDQIVARDLLAPDGEIYLIVSNTADLRGIARYAVQEGFRLEVVHHEDWPGDDVETFLFRVTR